MLRGNKKTEDMLSDFSSKDFPHAAIIEGENGEDRETLARLIASAVVCGRDDAPCGACPDCKKSALGVHPDILWLGMDQELKVDGVRGVRHDAGVRPNEAERKVFIIANADKMNVHAQNAMLKILEEPPSTVVFLLLCENRELMLPTVLSRCALYSLPPPARAGKGEDAPFVGEFVHALSGSSEFELLSLCMTMEKLKREEFQEFFRALSETICDAAAGGHPCSGAVGELQGAFSPARLCLMYDMIKELSDRIQFNAGNAALIASLVSKSIKIKT